MKDWFHSLTKWIDHNRYLMVGLVLTAAAMAWLAGCEPTTTSVMDPTTRVTAPELQREAIVGGADLQSRQAQIAADIETFNAALQAAESDLADQYEVRQQIVETVGGIGQLVAAGAVNPANLIGAGITLLGVLAGGGAVIDNRRKDAVIKSATATASGSAPPGAGS